MDDYRYYGLFLTDDSRNKLMQWVWENGKTYCVDKRDGPLYINHVTLLHSSRAQEYPELERRLEVYVHMTPKHCAPTIFAIDGIGWSYNALAFRCNIMPYFCAARVPHITICTFRGGVPKDSNNITEWRNINPIMVKGMLKKV